MEEKKEPIIPSLLKGIRTRKLRKKEEELDELRLEIEKAKLQRKLEEIRNGK